MNSCTSLDKLSKLNWIDGKDMPDVKELLVKTVIVSTRGGIGVIPHLNVADYNEWFMNRNDPVLRYAIIDTSEPEVPLPLWGVMPKLRNGDRGARGYYADYDPAGDGTGVWIQTQMYKTPEEAIAAWNKISNALNDIRL